MILAGGVDPHRPEDDTSRAQTRDRPDTTVQHVARRSEDVATEHQWRASVRQGHLYVPGEHRPDDQSDRLPTSSR